MTAEQNTIINFFVVSNKQTYLEASTRYNKIQALMVAGEYIQASLELEGLMYYLKNRLTATYQDPVEEQSDENFDEPEELQVMSPNE